MKVFIGYQSALEFWRIHRALPKNSVRQKRSVTLPGSPPPTEQVRLSGLAFPLHILLSNPKKRWGSQTMKQHMFSGKAPAGCFIGTEDGLEVSSPEFCFLQMSGRMPFPGDKAVHAADFAQ